MLSDMIFGVQTRKFRADSNWVIGLLNPIASSRCW